MHTNPSFDADLLRRYDRPGPRYTSYPTAPQFSSAFGEAQLRDAAAASNGDPIPRRLSLYVHVPFCMSPCFYCGCNRIITRDLSRGETYLVRLYREIAMMSELFDRDREVIQLHFGGGTPNFLAPAQLADVVDTLRNHFRFSEARERDLSIELDPRFVSPADVLELARIGFNRASLGVQDFDPAVQAAVNRIQSVEETVAIIDACREGGMRSVNVDLIYGLPKQNHAGFSRTLDTVVAARPDRLAVYSYAHLPEMFKAQRQIDAADLPTATEKLGLLQLAIEKLTAAGYVYIGMDHFALPDDELASAQEDGTLQRNFQGYTTHGHCDLVGLGVSAISQIGDLYCQNSADINDYQNSLDNGQLATRRGLYCNADDRVRRAVIQQLICHFQLDFESIEERFNIEFHGYFADIWDELERFAKDGLIELSPRGIDVTAAGRLLVRSLCMLFDHYLPHQNLQRFSRVI